MAIETLFSQTVSGLSEGMVIFFSAMGLTLIFGSLKVLNISHGSMYMIGAYFMVAGNAMFSALSGHFHLALVCATLGTGIVGGILEIVLIRPIYKLHHLFQFIVTFSATFVFMDLVKMVWGGAHYTITYPSYLQGPIEVSSVVLPKYNVALILFGLCVAVAMWIVINKSRLGVVIRGVTVDREMMGFLGHNVQLIYTVTFMIGCGLAGLGGAAVLAISAAGPGMDVMALMKSFLVIVIGGFGSIGGALLASIILGVVNAFGILVIPKVALGFSYFIMALVLIIRPWGLFGKPINQEGPQR